MKTLTLLRHAKSGWDDVGLRDFDRPLNGKGKRAAETVGRKMRDLGLSFDVVLASPAVRVRETLEHVQIGLAETLAPEWNKELYLASAESMLEAARGLPDGAETALLVGHNPGLEDLVLLLVPDRAGDGLRDDVEVKFPTASLAELSFDVGSWRDLKANGATLARFIRPRDLDASLGPDEH